MSGHDHIVVGQELTVTLDSIPSSGYRWVLQNVPSSLVLVGESLQDQADSGSIGGHVFHSFTFRAAEAGVFCVAFKLQRPWESRPLKTYDLEVLVT